MITEKSFIASIKKTKANNYFGYYNEYYIFIYRRPHGGWCYRIGSYGKWITGSGYFTKSLKTISIARKKIFSIMKTGIIKH